MEGQTTGNNVVVDSGFLHQLAYNITENVIYLMGFSFILGSLCTVILLLLLDFIRRSSAEKETKK